MPTITEINAAINSAIRNKVTMHSISPANVADQLASIANEFLTRGIKILLSTGELASTDSADGKLLLINENGVISLMYDYGDQPGVDGDIYFDGTDGKVWTRVLFVQSEADTELRLMYSGGKGKVTPMEEAIVAGPSLGLGYQSVNDLPNPTARLNARGDASEGMEQFLDDFTLGHGWHRSINAIIYTAWNGQLKDYFAISNPGFDYVVNDILSVDLGTGGQIKVESVDGDGAILTFSIFNLGSGYPLDGILTTGGGSGHDASITLAGDSYKNLLLNGSLEDLKPYRLHLRINSFVAGSLQAFLGAGDFASLSDHESEFIGRYGADAFKIKIVPSDDFSGNIDARGELGGNYLKQQIYDTALILEGPAKFLDFLGSDNLQDVIVDDTGKLNLSPIKKYVALISQLETDAPIENTILYSNLGGDIVFSRVDVGQYVLTLAGAFPANKVILRICSQNQLVNYQFGGVDADNLSLQTWHFTGGDFVLSDNIMDKASIEIIVYP